MSVKVNLYRTADGREMDAIAGSEMERILEADPDYVLVKGGKLHEHQNSQESKEPKVKTV